MATQRKYTVSLHQGRILVSPGSGIPASKEEVEWVKQILTTALRSQNFVNKHQKMDLRFADADKPVDGHKHEIEPLIIALYQEQQRLGIRTADIARIMGVHPTSVTAYYTGKSRPTIDALQSWAYLTDQEITLVPGALRKIVCWLIDTWLRLGRPTPVGLRDLMREESSDNGNEDSVSAKTPTT